MHTDTDTLNNLIETLKDGELGFQTAANDVTRNDLKTIFQRYSRQRAEFARELQEYVVSQGEEPEESGSMSGSLHRGWINVKSAVSGRDDVAILEECESGEDSALKTYREAMNQGASLDAAQTVVSRQFQEIKAAHDSIRALRDQSRAAAS